ncbi:ergothioneine biosynthesis protein EgtB [Synechocystis sp. PCC 7509]|uniref:ergothioneine biosynthesis protein EgtB n=1 Tax=Synechocystis sp. PCC 7509 TaxID=927677 RepID=UPI00056FB2F6|nr:ergothioneine biosynthesis protein EgtB [Synechocystis sp. PCC 7509]
MRSKSINFQQTSQVVDRRQQLEQWLHQCRTGTLELFESIDETTFCHQAHSEFSPVGWHLGHIGYTESLWLLERQTGIKPEFPEYRRLFVADGLPKSERVKLPPISEIKTYLEAIRNKVLLRLETVDLEQEERLWRWLLQHESQHTETIAFVMQLQRWHDRAPVGASWQNLTTQNKFTVHPALNSSTVPANCLDSEMVCIESGEFTQGNDSIDALDNERTAHQVCLDTYYIDRYPVTCGQYRAFIEAGSYQNPTWWSKSGWKWVQSGQVTKPLYWSEDHRWDNHPVCGVSWYEADAYARFVGKRLPSEAEWEKAAGGDCTYPWGEDIPTENHCNHDNTVNQTTPVNAYPVGQSVYGCYDLLGNVWEWTSTIFEGYEGFASYPYPGYSQVYFDREHWVLKGGSWATRPWALRSSFRNWYYPDVRQILAGFRCAKNK